MDWLEGCTLLGLSPVHIYSRTGEARDWLRRYKIASDGGNGATFRVAPPLSPETYNSDLLLERGLYADQARLRPQRQRLT